MILLIKVTAMQAELHALHAGLNQVSNYITELYVKGYSLLLDARDDFRGAIETILTLLGGSSS